MELNRDTKLKDIVSAYPSLKTRLAEINPKFSLLNSPIGKVMIGKVTISDMSQRSGMDMNSLIDGIRKLIEEETLST
ncbi:MAG: DUF1858 domain-containing protein [Clostridiales bacterium]|nr:DUF1858 domain-containing protein [Clostridiales bacterium]